MTTAMETELRRDLHDLADVLAPPSLADRALGRARSVRRRRAVVAGAGTLALVALVALPFAVDVRSLGWRLPFGDSGTTPCEEATDESQPEVGVAASDHPRFVRLVLSKLPPRDDYTLQSAFGVCPPLEPEGPTGEQRQAYAVVNLGPNREQGHMTVTLSRMTDPFTCATLPTPEGQIIFCEDATAAAPLVLGVGVDGDFIVTAVYPDGRTVSIGAWGTPFTAAQLRPTVTDPAVAALLD